ncbi:MAG TPA: hypothetical protein EYP19_10110 [Desulfobacterales bacterium]|nr:hypothetical protein [Desulfobacterales bacterium]
MRLLILCFLIYLGYWIFKKWALPRQSSTTPSEEIASTAVDDVMVRDPFCQTYLAKKQGIKCVINEETHYFCSTACRDKYLEAIKKSGSK